MNITLRKLSYAVATARNGSISKAAQELFVSQSGVSAAIDALEQDLGVRLFHRHPAKGVVLTPAGREIVARAKGLLDATDDFKAFAADLVNELAGELTVGCFTPFSSILLPPVLKAFTERYPNITVQLEEGDVPAIQKRLLDNSIDIMLGYDLGLRPDLAREDLIDAPTHAVFAETDPMARHPKVRLRDLAEKPMIQLDQPISRDYFRDLFAARGLTPRIAYRTHTVQTLCELVGSGMGFSLLNLRPPHDWTYHGSALVRRPLADKTRAPRMVLAYPIRGRPTPVVEAFAALCRKHVLENADTYTLNGAPPH